MTCLPKLQEWSESESEKRRLEKSYEIAWSFPKNLVYHDTYGHVLQEYFNRLDEQEERLFFDESKSNISIMDYDSNLKCFENMNLTSCDDLSSYIHGQCLFSNQDPSCRFVFVYAPHSRECLRVTREMLMLVFTYHQVMPAFLDFLFPFGRQQYAQDFHFSGFRQEGHISPYERGLRIPELGRSGRDFRICYSLKSVEPSKGQPNWPWSIRQTAVYSSFDIETGRGFWTVVKGNQLLKERIEEATRGDTARKTSSFETLASSFASCLATHLIFFDWCREYWRWYINYLEAALEAQTRDTLLIEFNKTHVQQPRMRNHELNPNDRTSPTIEKQVEAKVQYQPKQIIRGEKHHNLNTTEKQRSPIIKLEARVQQRPNHAASWRVPSPNSTNYDSEDGDGDDSDDAEKSYSFKDLQRVQFLEDKSNEVLLVLQANADVLIEIQTYFADIVASLDWPVDLKESSSKGMATIAKFNRTTLAVISDLRLQRARATMVLRLLSDRKSLLTGIMDFENRQANRIFAQKAQLSTERMEAMTENMQDLNREMHEIAKQTKQETVSMRIITLVTLFFLPGTFISTMMSTDILQFNATVSGSQEVFQLAALLRYLEITLPLMLLTFAAWYGVYWWVNRQQRAIRRKKQKLDATG